MISNVDGHVPALYIYIYIFSFVGPIFTEYANVSHLLL